MLVSLAQQQIIYLQTKVEESIKKSNVTVCNHDGNDVKNAHKQDEVIKKDPSKYNDDASKIQLQEKSFFSKSYQFSDREYQKGKGNVCDDAFQNECCASAKCFPLFRKQRRNNKQDCHKQKKTPPVFMKKVYMYTIRTYFIQKHERSIFHQKKKLSQKLVLCIHFVRRFDKKKSNKKMNKVETCY